MPVQRLERIGRFSLLGTMYPARMRIVKHVAGLSGVTAIVTAALLFAWALVALAEQPSRLAVTSGVVLVGSMAVVGHLIAGHRPGNRLGRLLQVLAVVQSVVLLATSYREWAVGRETEPPLVRGAMLLDFWLWGLPFIGLPLVLLWFPDGRLPTPRWRWTYAVLGMGALGFMVSRLIPVDLADGQELPSFPNPTGIPGADGLEAAMAALPVAVNLAFLAGVGAVVRRYSRTDQAGRRQMRWLLLGAAGAAAILVLGFGADALGWPEVVEVAVLLVPPVLMASIAVAVLREQAQEQAGEATSIERTRLRRDLHDGVGSSLTGIRLSVASLAVRHPELRDELHDLSADVEQTLVELGRLVDDLAPPALVGRHLGEALEETASPLRAAGIEVSIDVNPGVDTPELPASHEVALYRIAAEALTNIAKHADARSCGVRIQVASDRVYLTVTDDGRGLDTALVGSGVGLGSMADRAGDLGGEVTVSRGSQGGTTLRAVLPVVTP